MKNRFRRVCAGFSWLGLATLALATHAVADDAAAGAFNFAFVPFTDATVRSGNLAVQQFGLGNAANEVAVTLDGASPGITVIGPDTNRGDYAIYFGASAAGNVESGTLIAAVRENGRDHGQGQGVQYGTVAIEVSGRRNYYLALSEFPSGTEYNANVAVAHFPYTHFTAGFARNSVNNGPITQLYSSPDVVLGDNFVTLYPGVYGLALAGIDSRSDGVLLTVGGRNDDNFGKSRPLDDGSGFLIGVSDNGRDGAVFEPDGVSFVFLRKGASDLVFGRVLSDGSAPVSQGEFELRKTGTGEYHLRIAGASPDSGTLLVSAEGFDLLNQDNAVSYQADGDGWTIQTRDTTSRLLQDAGAAVFPTGFDALPDLPPVAPPHPANAFRDTMRIWQDASIEHTLVVAHRAGYYEHGVTRWPENSVSAIEHAIELGVNMVEIDVWKTADGHYVVIHDETVDRTTNGTGRVRDLTLAQIKALRLVIEDSGEVTSETVPTLAEALALTRDRIMVNLDVKLPIADFIAILNVAREQGVDHQVVIKSSVETPEQIAAVQSTLAALPYAVDFMPIMRDNAVNDPAFIRTVFEAFAPQAMEVIVRPGADDLVADGGFMFSPAVRALAAEFDVRLWINSLYSGFVHGGDLNGLRNDFLALIGYPDEVFDFWVGQGASVIQTDESRLAIGSLQRVGARPRLVLGTAGNDRLVGSDADEVILPLAGRMDVMSGGGGADVFKFGPELANGVRETRYVTDFEPGIDRIDLGGATVHAHQLYGDRVVLHVGADRDVITVSGATSIEQLRLR